MRPTRALYLVPGAGGGGPIRQTGRNEGIDIIGAISWQHHMPAAAILAFRRIVGRIGPQAATDAAAAGRPAVPGDGRMATERLIIRAGNQHIRITRRRWAERRRDRRQTGGRRCGSEGIGSQPQKGHIEHRLIAINTKIIPPDPIADINRCRKADPTLFSTTVIISIKVGSMIFRPAEPQIAVPLALDIPVIVMTVPRPDIIHRRDTATTMVGDAHTVLMPARAGE